MSAPDISVILPCRNEEAALTSCLTSIQRTFRDSGLRGEIIVSDSSHDRSPHIAAALGARVIKHDQEGYGVALRQGFAAAQSPYLLCADADGTYDFAQIPQFVAALRDHNDMVIGDRLHGTLTPGALPWLHRYVGVPVTALLLHYLFGSTVADPHCGLRAITREAYDRLTLTSSGMEFASEMIVQALRHNLRIRQLPISYRQRVGTSKLRPWPDGWRHVRLLLHRKFSAE